MTEKKFPSVNDMFGAGQEEEQAIIDPEEMRGMAEESVRRVGTREN